MMLFWALLLIVIVVVLLRLWPEPPTRSRSPSALEELQRRYARGEISTREYEQRKAQLKQP
ncbi:SHOCT domain-containing protein [Rhodocaloribacter litoris]|uniref:SHOCT domain-containing protein n=1 Tax=Rhodocaloribacter litoris TaxID=2558931 RepID=UPI001E3EF105|nr:SHOCT domain-containing protein [Rhodocaloribacter litoris]